MAYSLTGQKKCYVTENPEIVFFFFFIAKLGYMNIQEEFLILFLFFVFLFRVSLPPTSTR